MDWKDIGRCIRKKRREKNLKQDKLAELAHISYSYIGMIERGEKIPSLETFVLLANALDVSADELLPGVLNKGYEIRASEYVKRIETLNKDKQRVVYALIDVLMEE